MRAARWSRMARSMAQRDRLYLRPLCSIRESDSPGRSGGGRSVTTSGPPPKSAGCHFISQFQVATSMECCADWAGGKADQVSVVQVPHAVISSKRDDEDMAHLASTGNQISNGHWLPEQKRNFRLVVATSCRLSPNGQPVAGRTIATAAAGCIG